MPCGNSGIVMAKHLGFGYEHFLYLYRNDYCEMSYGEKDLQKIWKEMKNRYEKDKDYFVKLEQQYKSINQPYKEFQEQLDALDLKDLEGEEFLMVCRKASRMAVDVVNVSHTCEAFSMINDRKLKQKIEEKVKDKKKINRVMEQLSRPIANSWVNDNEESLHKIAISDNQEELLKEHAMKFFWIRNNYLRGTPLTVDDFRREIDQLKDYHALDFDMIKKEKQQLIEELELDKETQDIIQLIEFFVHFQDIRKKNILIAMFYMERFAQEIAQRFKINKEHET